MGVRVGADAMTPRGAGDELEPLLRRALGRRGQRYTEQRAAVYRFLVAQRTHPTADEVFTTVRAQIPDISLATVYKALEALVGCDLAVKLRYGDAAARYDGRTDPHPHAHCRVCGAVRDVSGPMVAPALESLGGLDGFVVEGYRLEVAGRCADCA